MVIEELILGAASPEAQAEFYGAALCLPVTRGGDGEVVITVGTSRLVFQPVANRPIGPYHVAFNILPNRLPAAREWLRSRVISPVTDQTGTDEFVFANWEARATYFEDADKNLLELIARCEVGEDTYSASSFDASEILAISEIGVAVDDVPTECENLMRALPGLTPYRQEVNDAFVALGDSSGLLIVVRTGRTWFPTTDQAAVPLPTRVRVHTDATSEGVTFTFGEAATLWEKF